LPKGMDRGGVSILSGEIREHGVEHLRLNGSGGVMVQVNAMHRLLSG